MKRSIFLAMPIAAAVMLSGGAFAQAQKASRGFVAEAKPSGPVCVGYGPQSPRDIRQTGGSNRVVFPYAPPPSEMNLCNVRFHAGAENQGPDFLHPAKAGEWGGFRCNQADRHRVADYHAPADGCHDPHNGHNLKPGDTIEVHWVFSTCDVKPGKSLAACSSKTCTNPTLRVESQVFVLVDTGHGHGHATGVRKFSDYDYPGHMAGSGLHQPKSLPTQTGKAVQFRGSTTNEKYNETNCSDLQVTWRVRSQCAMLDIASLHAWCKSNAFDENHAHGTRPLVTAPSLLSKI